MKVSETLNKPSNMTEILTRDEKRIADSKDSTFQSQLKRAADGNFEERVNELVNKIFEQGEKLAKKVDIKELKTYKNLISDFLDEAVNNSHKFSKQNLLDRRGRHKVYATVKKVNEELADLTRDVLSSEKDNIKILKRLDDIRGLILDIVM